jgi:hypothetical protein
MNEQQWTLTLRDPADGTRSVASSHPSRGAAVEAWREARRADEQATSRYGVPSARPRVELDGTPVDVD